MVEHINGSVMELYGTTVYVWGQSSGTLCNVIKRRMERNNYGIYTSAYTRKQHTIKLLLNAGSRIKAGSLINAGVPRPVF